MGLKQGIMHVVITELHIPSFRLFTIVYKGIQYHFIYLQTICVIYSQTIVIKHNYSLSATLIIG